MKLPERAVAKKSASHGALISKAQPVSEKSTLPSEPQQALVPGPGPSKMPGRTRASLAHLQPSQQSFNSSQRGRARSREQERLLPHILHVSQEAASVPALLAACTHSRQDRQRHVQVLCLTEVNNVCALRAGTVRVKRGKY